MKYLSLLPKQTYAAYYTVRLLACFHAIDLATTAYLIGDSLEIMGGRV
jgi:hypothetical protein